MLAIKNSYVNSIRTVYTQLNTQTSIRSKNKTSFLHHIPWVLGKIYFTLKKNEKQIKKKTFHRRRTCILFPNKIKKSTPGWDGWDHVPAACLDLSVTCFANSWPTARRWARLIFCSWACWCISPTWLTSGWDRECWTLQGNYHSIKYP